MKKSELTKEQLKQLENLQSEKNRKLVKKFIIDKTESKIVDKYSDSELDKINEKKRLLKFIDDYWKIDEVNNQVLKKPLDYEKIFPQEYYKEIFRLNDWNYEGFIAQKPWVVGKFTNELIYYRFSQEVLPFLRLVNPFIIPGVRKYKHHQYLTPGSRIELKKYIDQAVNMMKTNNDWNGFRVSYCKKYNVPYQLKLKI